MATVIFCLKNSPLNLKKLPEIGVFGIKKPPQSEWFEIFRPATVNFLNYSIFHYFNYYIILIIILFKLFYFNILYSAMNQN